MDDLIETMYSVIIPDMFHAEVPPTLENLIEQIALYEEKIYEEFQQKHARDIYVYRYLMAIRMELARLQSLLPEN